MLQYKPAVDGRLIRMVWFSFKFRFAKLLGRFNSYEVVTTISLFDTSLLVWSDKELNSDDVFPTSDVVSLFAVLYGIPSSITKLGMKLLTSFL